LVLNITPFYAESGGQVGDNGSLLGATETIRVLDTKKENDLIVHEVDKLPMDISQSFDAQVNEERRLRIMSNHTATHLLQSALKQVLGDHIQQKGSLVNEELLRFDFSHYAKLTDGELNAVEAIVNERIRANIQLDEKRNLPIGEAKAMGATALFGEKYGEYVRVITFGKDFSVELCGGTHVQATGNIGYFKIISEGSISAGVRRIEAITSIQAETYVREQLHILKEIQEILKAPRDIRKSVAGLLLEKNELRKEIEGLHLKQAAQIKDQLVGRIHRSGDLDVLVASVTLPSADALKKLSYELKNEADRFVGVIIADILGKPQIAVVIDESVVAEKRYDAGAIVRELAKHIQGGGGGQPFFATAGGKNLEGIPLAVNHAKEILSYPSE
jgi:alanyl-tRNA synthetase